MNVKHWALFFVVTLSINYVSATFLPFLGGGSRSRGGVRSYSGWNRCNKRMYYYFSENIESVKRVVQSTYGGQCSLGYRELDNYSLKRIRAKGFGDFTFGDTCQYYVEGGQAYIRLGIGYEQIIASFVLGIEETAGGIFGQLAEAIFGIIGHFVNKFLQIVFPSFFCDIIVVGDYSNGFRLHDFRILKPEGDIGFMGGLAGHGDTLGSYSSLFFEPLYFVINLFFGQHIRPIWRTEIGNWECNRYLFKRWGLDLGIAGGYGVSGLGGGSGVKEIGGGSDDGEPDVGVAGEDDGGDEGLGGLGYGGKTGGRKSGGGSVRGRQSGGYRSGGRSRYGGKPGGYGYNRRSRYGGVSGGGYETDEGLEYGEGTDGREYRYEESESDESGDGGYGYRYSYGDDGYEEEDE